MAKGKGSTSGSKSAPKRGGMPPQKLSGGASTGTTHGNHHVAHPVQGQSGSQTIYRKGGSDHGQS